MQDKSKVLTSFTEAKKFIRKQPTIRVGIENGPGLGNHVAGLHLVEWLKQFYPGYIEVIYENSAAPALATLLDLPSHFTVNQPFDVNDKLRLISVSHWLNYRSSAPLINLGFKATGEYYSGLSASFFKTRSFLNFSPHLRPHSPTLLSTLMSPLYPLPSMNDASSAWAIRYPVPSLIEALKELKNPSTPKEQGVFNLMEMIRTKQIESWSIYGMHVNFSLIKPHLTLINFLLTACYLRTKKFINKPIALLVFNELSEQDWKSLKGILNSIAQGNYNQSAAHTNLQNTANSYQLISKIVLKNITDLAESGNTFNEDNLLLINIGKLPRKIFEAIYTASDKLSPLQEGANTQSGLLNEKIPYLHCRTQNEEWNLILPFADEKTKSLFNAIHALTCPTDLSAWKNSQKLPHKQLGNFIINSRNSSNPVGNFWSNLFNQYHQPENDIYLRGVSETLTTYPKIFTMEPSSKQDYLQFSTAIRNGNQTEVTQLLQKNVSTIPPDYDSLSLRAIAFLHGKYEVMSMIPPHPAEIPNPTDAYIPRSEVKRYSSLGGQAICLRGDNVPHFPLPDWCQMTVGQFSFYHKEFQAYTKGGIKSPFFKEDIMAAMAIITNNTQVFTKLTKDYPRVINTMVGDQTLLSIASLNHNEAILKLLHARSVSLNRADIYTAIKYLPLPDVQKILAECKSLDCRIENDKTLEALLLSEDPEVINFFFKHTEIKNHITNDHLFNAVKKNNTEFSIAAMESLENSSEIFNKIELALAITEKDNVILLRYLVEQKKVNLNRLMSGERGVDFTLLRYSLNNLQSLFYIVSQLDQKTCDEFMNSSFFEEWFTTTHRLDPSHKILDKFMEVCHVEEKSLSFDFPSPELTHGDYFSHFGCEMGYSFLRSFFSSAFHQSLLDLFSIKFGKENAKIMGYIFVGVLYGYFTGAYYTQLFLFLVNLLKDYCFNPNSLNTVLIFSFANILLEMISEPPTNLIKLTTFLGKLTGSFSGSIGGTYLASGTKFILKYSLNRSGFFAHSKKELDEKKKEETSAEKNNSPIITTGNSRRRRRLPLQGIVTHNIVENEAIIPNEGILARGAKTWACNLY